MINKDGIWTFVEQFEGSAAPVSFELIGEARKLADTLEEKVSAVIFGYNVKHLAEQAIGYGADKVYLIDDVVLKDYRNEPYFKTLVSLVKEHYPEILLFGATVQGRDLAGSVATETNSGLTADCTALDIDPENKKLLQTRPAYGGNIMATIWCRNEATQMSTVRPRVMPMPDFDKNRNGEIIQIDCPVKEEEINAKVTGFQLTKQNGEIDLPYADIIVSVGKGIANMKNLEKVKELAKVLGAHIGASRGAVDMGLLDHNHQVGQTGKTVRSKIYIALGISGAVQHLVGMQSSDFIIAVNNNPKAAIFNVADVGIVGDLNEIVPLLIEDIKRKANG
jgi:electron transfer flavoprotein alpha subunit